MAPAYRWHRTFLQHLQSRHPADTLGAEVARPHLVPRRAARRVPGRAPRADAPRPAADHRVARRRSSRRCAALASDDRDAPGSGGRVRRLHHRRPRPLGRRPGSTAPSPADRVIDVQFDAFMADPFATIRPVYDHLGLEFTADAEARMRDVPRRPHRRTSYGKHRVHVRGDRARRRRAARARPPLPGVLRASRARRCPDQTFERRTAIVASAVAADASAHHVAVDAVA